MRPEGDVLAAERRPIGPQLGNRVRGAGVLEPVVDAVLVDVAGADRVDICRRQLVIPVVADVTDVPRGVGEDLALVGQVPLPVVGRLGRLLAARVGRAVANVETRGARRQVRVERAGPVLLGDERRIGTDVQPGAETFTQVELPNAGADRRLAVAIDVPRDAEARREVALVLREDPSLLCRSPALESGLAAPIAARGLQHAVTWIAAERGVEQRRIEA